MQSQGEVTGWSLRQPLSKSSVSQERTCLTIPTTLSPWLGAAWEARHGCKGSDGFQRAAPGAEVQVYPLKSQIRVAAIVFYSHRPSLCTNVQMKPFLRIAKQAPGSVRYKLF